MKTIVVVYFALVVLAMSACQKSSDGGGGGGDATVPGVSAECVNNPTLCKSNLYNTPGYTPYNYGNGSLYGGGYYNGGYNGGYSGGYSGGYGSNYNSNYYSNPFNTYNNSSYLCNCPSGSIPTYNSYAGLGCVQQTQVYAGVSAYAYFGWNSGAGANNQQWTNIPQISNQVGYGQSSCYNGVMQSCLVDQPSSCAVGYSCQSTSAASRMGLCTATNRIGSNGGYGAPVR
ncbi:MAG: hypothetical protein H7256_05075 [Bdellovibrio sp.]|nr:hypothetical protein [Bdellovibrio sp.]